MQKIFLAFSAIALLCVGAFGQSSGLPDANAVHVVGGKADKVFNLNDGSTPASQAYVVSAISGSVGGGGTTPVTTNQVVATKTTTASSWNKICTPSGGQANTAGGLATVACGGTSGDPVSVTVQTKLATPVLNTVGVTNSVGTYGLTTNSTSERDILVPTTVSTNYTATVFKREQWFKDGTNLAGIDNYENDIYMFDQPDQWEFMLGWQCNRHNTGFWQYDNFKHGWVNTAVPCSIISGHTYHWILWMHRDVVSSTACTQPAYSYVVSGVTHNVPSQPAPCEHWDTFQLDDITAGTSNTYTINATLNAELATGRWDTWTGIGSQVQLDVVDGAASSGSPQFVSMSIDNDSLTTYIPVTASQSSSQTVTETTGNLGEYDFDSSTPTSGLTVTGSPTVDNTNSYTPANGVLFNAATEYYTAPISTTGSTVYGRALVNVATQTVNSTQFLALYNGTSELFNLFFNAGNGFITANNTVGTGISTTCSTTALSTGVWHLIEFAWTKGTGVAGSFQVLIDGTQTCSVSGMSTGASLPTSIRFGELTSPASPWIFSMDNVGFASTGLLGKVTVSNAAGAPLYDLNGAAAAVQATSLQASNNLSDISNLGQAQINLGLGASAFYNTVGTDTNIPTSGQLVGTAGTLVCIDAAGGIDTVGCPTNGVTSLTTTGTSGAATLVAGVLNVPQYTTGGSGGASTPATSLILKGNGSANGVVAAVPGTDFNIPSAGVFYLSNYSASGSHTPYDMARQAADAYAVANPSIGSVLILPAGTAFTCDAVALPVSSSGWGTTSIIGAGVNVTTIKKQTGCTAGAATFSHPDSTGPLSRGYYFGFTVDANHIDAAACETYGYQITTFNQIACGNAALGGDHEWEMGNNDASNVGWADNIYGHQLQTFDTVGTGKGGILTPVWSGTALSSLTVTNAGTKSYSQYVHGTLIGPGVALCTTVPVIAPTITNSTTATYANIGTVNYGPLSGATITTAGNCSSAAQTAGIYVLVQDGPNPTYGFKMTNTADSHFWDVEPTGANTYGVYWNSHSGNNEIVGEHPYTNATVGVYDAGPGNRHTNAEIDGAGQYGFQIQSTTGSIQNPMFLWDSTTSYIGATAFYFSNSAPSYLDYTVSNSQCSSVTPNFVLAAYSGSSIPAGVHLNNASLCDGSSTNVDRYAYAQTRTREGQALYSDQIVSTTEIQRHDINIATGVDQPFTDTLANGFIPTSQATEQASPARKFMTNCYNGSSGSTQVIMQLVPQTGVAGQALFNIIGSGNCNVPLYIPSSIFTNGNGVYLGSANNFNVGTVSSNGDLNFRANGANSFGISSVDGSPYTMFSEYGDLAAAHLLAVGAPVLANIGTTGSTSYTYAVTAVTVDGGETLIGTAAATASGNATLSGSNYNTIKAPFVRGAFAYNVYRHANAGGLTNGLIGTITYSQQAANTVLQDTGQSATTAEPAVDTTGALAIRNGNGGTLTFFTRFRQSAQLSATQDIQLGTTASGWITPDNGETVTFSATPVFSSTATYSYLQLTGSVTGFTMASGPYNGFRKVVDICQDATGGRGFPTSAAPSNVKGFNIAANATAQTCTTYTFVYSTPQTVWDTVAIVQDASASVLSTRLVNGHALSSDVVVSASDLTTGTLPHAQLPTLLTSDIPTVNTTLGDLAYGGASGAATRLAGPTAGTVPYNLCSIPSGGAATAPAWCLAGLGGRSVTTTSDTVAATDRGVSITYSNAGSIAVALTSAATLGNNFDFVTSNQGAGAVTFTPGAGTINGGSTLVMNQGESCAINSPDNTNYIARCSSGQLIAGTNVTFTRSAAGVTIASSGGASGFPITLGSTSIASSSTTTTLAGLTLSSPTLTTPALGTPASGILTNATGLPLTTGVTGVLPVANGGAGSLVTGSGLTSGNVYYMSASALTAAKADVSTTVPAICFAISTTQCQTSGVVTTSGLTQGAIYYVSDSTAGAITATAPTTSGHFVQRFGVALSTTTLLVNPSIDVGGVQ